MFGKDALLHEQLSEDEDWGPKRKRRRKKESDAANTLVTLFESNEKDLNAETIEAGEKFSVENKGRPTLRLPRDAVERLRQVFADDELPSKSARDDLSKELGLDPEKVTKWFKNARYMALKNRKTESTKQQHGSIGFSADSEPEAIQEMNVKPKDPEDNLVETVSHPKNISPKFQKKNKQVDGKLSNDMIPKNIVEEKNRESNITEETVEFETVMEKLCRIQNKIHDMKFRLSRFRRTRRGRKKLGKSSHLLEEDSIVYVPIAEIKEKKL